MGASGTERPKEEGRAHDGARVGAESEGGCVKSAEETNAEGCRTAV